jgi:tRNA1Val (adenine37-N6)-methyltransferase
MVHRPSRLAEIIEVLCRYNLEPKRMRLVQPTYDKPANMVLIEAIKEAGHEMKVLPTLVVYGKDGEYTKEILEIYGKI